MIQKQYYALVTCMITFINPQGEPETVVKQFPSSSLEPTFPVNYLNRLRETAAQDVAAQVRNSLVGDAELPPIKVLDVLIDNIVPLGLMTREEFFGAPEHQEQDVASAGEFTQDVAANETTEGDDTQTVENTDTNSA